MFAAHFIEAFFVGAGSIARMSLDHGKNAIRVLKIGEGVVGRHKRGRRWLVEEIALSIDLLTDG